MPLFTRPKGMILTLLCCSLFTLPTFALAQDACVTWERVLPPAGIEIPAERLSKWQSRIAALDKKLSASQSSVYWADVEVLVKACRLAIMHREFYSEKDFAKCDRLLKLAEDRSSLLTGKSSSGPTPLPAPEGQQRLQARGFKSAIDGSAQPVGIILPETMPSDGQQLPLFVWLHGRGDKSTDLHFLCERLDKKGEVAPAGAITLHPFGRHCVGYKNAGSTDVMEAIDFACANYPIDKRKIVLIGFSMGGAGVWHLAAHYADRFVAASPGAGFAETARYQNLSPDKYPSKPVQLMWGVYDVPCYTRNLFNLPVIAYSGEIDKQIQAARIMEEAFQTEGRTLKHLIGPGMGHKYHPDVLKDLIGQLETIAAAGQPVDPETINLQTRHWRFAKQKWLQIDGLQEPYANARVDAQKQTDGSWRLDTRNVTRLELTVKPGNKLTVDGQSLVASSSATPLRLVRDSGSNKWQVGQFNPVRKHPGLSGPIDDAFFDPFIFVKPTGKSSNVQASKWCECEMEYAINRWRSLMRGEPRVMRDVDVTADDMRKASVVLWGDPESNQLLARLIKSAKAPVSWSNKEIRVGDKSWDAAAHMPALIMPNPEALDRYVVINSGLTFRDAHDRTNSLQNPQLPDWAVFSLASPRSAQAAGNVVAQGFFDDKWQ